MGVKGYCSCIILAMSEDDECGLLPMVEIERSDSRCAPFIRGPYNNEIITKAGQKNCIMSEIFLIQTIVTPTSF